MIWTYVLQLAVATWIFIRGQEQRSHFAIRVPVCFGITVLICQGTGMLCADAIAQYKLLGTGKYLFDMTMVVVMFYHCYRLRWKDVIFYATSGYALQNIAHYVSAIVATFWLDPYSITGISRSLMDDASFVLVYALAYIWTRTSCRMRNDGIENRSIMAIALITIMFAIVLSDQIPIGDPLSIIYYLYDIFSLIVVLFLQYGLVENNELQKEKSMIQQMLRLQQEQHAIAEDAIALINLKCHDLKHQLLAFEQKGYADEKVIRDINETIQTYDSMIKTGNEALDIVLTEKSLKCANNGITFKHLIDGTLFDFMETADIYAFFGNVLDNAIEAQLAEETDRYIYLKAAARGNLVCVHVENTCSREVVFVDGMPVTTKTTEPGYHGFGTKSIRYIAEKYHGYTQMTWRDHLFLTDAFLQIIDGE